VGGAVVLVGCGINKSIKSFKTHLPSSKENIQERNHQRLREAQSLVWAAQEDLQREKEKWFNHAAIDAAAKSLAAKRALLLACQQDLALDSEIDASEVTQGCWPCSLQRPSRKCLVAL